MDIGIVWENKIRSIAFLSNVNFRCLHRECSHIKYVLVDREENYVGIFNLRHFLNDFLANGPGHIGYGISSDFRRKGYATKGLALVLEEAKRMGIEEAYLSVHKDNPVSLKVQQNNGAIIHHEDEKEYYTRIVLE